GDVAWGYTDLARWQLARVGGTEGHRLFEHWRRRLDPLPPPLELPTDRPPGVGSAARAGSRWASVDAPRLAGLERLARLCHTPLSAGLGAPLAGRAGGSRGAGGVRPRPLFARRGAGAPPAPRR